jgi:HK97 family phage prohead protease
MPWTVEDVDKHKSGLSSDEKKKWVAIANSARQSCMDKGGSEKSCSISAIQIANSKVGPAKENKRNEMKNNVEYRFYDPQDVELRAFTENDQMILEGYAAKYDVMSGLISEKGQIFNEIIERGTFKNHIKDNVYLTYNHNKDKVLATTKNDTLVLSEDDKGLKFRATLNNTTDSKDVYERVLRGDLNENSFGFIPDPKKQKVERAFGRDPIKRISGIESLIDVSVVTRAAYPQTELYVRALEEEPIETIVEEPKIIDHTRENNELELINIKLKIT